jgi:hypothetical protein
MQQNNNQEICKDFINKSEQFLSFPISILESEIKISSSKEEEGKSSKALYIIKKIKKEFIKLKEILNT